MDPVQLIASFVAIVLLAGLARWLFPAKEILTLDAAKADYQRYHAEAVLGKPLIDKNRKSILFLLENFGDQLGLVSWLGDQPVCRTVSKTDLHSIEVSGNSLLIKTHDFTQPMFSLLLEDSDLDEAAALREQFGLAGKEAGNAA